MLVLAIVGILGVVAVPKYRSITEYYHLQSSVQTVTSSIRYAKQRALDEHKSNYVGITKATANPANRVQVRNDPTLLLVEYQAKSLDAGVTLLSDPSTFEDTVMSYVYFNNRGYLVSNTADSATFKLKSSSNRIVELNIDLLGNVSTVWN